MNKKILLILSVILLVSAACSLSGGQQTGSQADVVSINFLTNQPPLQLYEDQNFRVGLNVKNYAKEKKDVSICIYDELREYFSGISENTCNLVKLDAAEESAGNILPSDKKIYFPSQEDLYVYNNIKGTMSTLVVYEATYEHKTIANTQICIKRDVDLEVSGANCDPTTIIKEVENNDAPVRISNLEKTFYPIGKDKVAVSLKFDVANAGSGKVINKKAVKSREELDPLVDIKVNLLGITDKFKCNPTRDEKIEFKENQKTIKCDTTIDISQDYIVNPVEISLDYGYKITGSVGPINLIDKDQGGKIK